MSHQPEHLSAGMDGELSDEELRFLLRRVDHDVSLQLRWSHYHVAGDALRGELPSALASAGFAGRVMAAIDAEMDQAHRTAPAAVAPPVRRHGWLKFSAGGAIAASVAVAALMANHAGGPELVAPAPAVTPLAQSEAPSVQAKPARVAPASVPAGLSRVNAFRYSQLASFPVGDAMSSYEQSLSPYRVNGYRTRTRADGSYLILVDPTRSPARRSVREAAVAQ